MDRPAVVRVRRRSRLRRRGDSPGGGPAGGGTTVHRRALRARGGHRVPAGPRTPPSGHDAAAAGRAGGGGPLPLPDLQRQPLDLSRRTAGQPVARGILRRRAGRVRVEPDGLAADAPDAPPDAGPHPRHPRPRGAPPARSGGGVADSVSPPGLAGRRRPPRHRDRAVRPTRTSRAPRRRLTEVPVSLTHVRTCLSTSRSGVWFGRVAGLARPW